MADWVDVPEDEEWVDVPEGGATGGTGSDRPGSSKQFNEPERHPYGSPKDALKSLADTAALGGAPQIEGLIAAGMSPDRPLEAYEDVRNQGEKEHAASDDTWWGRAGQLLGMVATPVPGKALPKGAKWTKHAQKGAKTGAVVGGVHGAVNSDADLVKDDGWQKYAEMLKDTAIGAGGGTVVGSVAGGTLGAIEKPARSVARRLPMDMLGVGEPARRSMQRQGIYDEAGDALLELVKPLRSGMRKGSLTEDAVAELGRRGERQGATEAAIDALAPEGAVTTGGQADAIRRRAQPFSEGSVQDKQVAARMEKEAKNLLDTVGSTDPEIGVRIPLAEAEKFKQRFGPAVGKQLRHAGEPAAKTDALAEVYRALKEANEAGAADINPGLAEQFVKTKKDYQTLAAPLAGANVERSGMRGSDFDWGDALSQGPAPGSPMAKWFDNSTLGAAVKVPLDLVGRAYGRGTIASLAELIANGAANRTGGGVSGQLGDAGASMVVDELAPWSKFIDEKKRDDE